MSFFLRHEFRQRISLVTPLFLYYVDDYNYFIVIINYIVSYEIYLMLLELRVPVNENSDIWMLYENIGMGTDMRLLFRGF